MSNWLHDSRIWPALVFIGKNVPQNFILHFVAVRVARGEARGRSDGAFRQRGQGGRRLEGSLQQED